MNLIKTFAQSPLEVGKLNYTVIGKHDTCVSRAARRKSGRQMREVISRLLGRWIFAYHNILAAPTIMMTLICLCLLFGVAQEKDSVDDSWKNRFFKGK